MLVHDAMEVALGGWCRRIAHLMSVQVECVSGGARLGLTELAQLVR